MESLFENDEAYVQAEVKKKRTLVRDLSGRFCTPEKRRMEVLERENKILRRKAEMYERSWFAAIHKAIRLEREKEEICNDLKECKKQLREYAKGRKRKADKKR